MKKLNVILLILSFILSGIGSIFLFDATSTTNDSIQTAAPSNKIESEEITEYTYKTYEDYFIDYFNLPAETYTRDETTGNVTISYSQIARKTINGEIQLLYNGNVFYVVTSGDLTGTGSQTDPYVIHSTNGFLYLFNSLLCQVGIAYKYMELECDLVLNDETFDKDGNPSGGDGNVYNYYCSKGYDNYTRFNGNGYSLIGLYGVEKDGKAGIFSRNLFGQMCMEEVKNLNIENSYVYGGNNSVTNLLAYRINNLDNCKALSGTVVTKGISASVFCREIVNASNCENYVDVYSSIGEGGVGGFFAQCYSAKLENLNNYGNLTVENGKQSRIGGIIQYVLSSKAYIKNCNNYGAIKGNVNQNGGICSWGRGTFINCNNYGSVAGTGQIGGIVGRGNFDSENDYLNIINCKNFGAVLGDSVYDTAEIVGYLAQKGNIKITNCFADTTNAIPMFGNCAGREITLSNCQINMKINNAKAVYLLFGITNAGCENNITISNIDINIEKINDNPFYLFFKAVGTSTENINIKNVHVRSNDSYKSFKLMNNSNQDISNIQSFIMNVKNDKSFYGSDFSGFYFLWRTGKVGLVALDGRGQFQGAIDEEWLKNNGYTKKSA